MPGKLKFAILNKIEYIDLVKNRVTVLTLTGADVKDGSSWRDLQLLCGSLLSPGVYSYGLKFLDDDEVHRGSIKAVSIKKNLGSDMESPEIKKLNKEISALQEKIAGFKNETPGFDMLIQMTRQGYESQISILRDEINRKEKSIDKLESKVDSLETENSNAAEIITDLKNKTGLPQYLEVAKEFLLMKAGKAKPITDLKDSNTGDLPPEVLEVLGMVNWSEIKPNVLQEIVHYLKIFIQKLPLKG